MGVFDLSGPEFLALYGALIAGAGTLSVFLRRLLRRPGGFVDTRFLKLEPLEVAYLAGGERQAITALVASLAQRKLVAVDAKMPTFTFTGPLPAGADRVEHQLQKLLGTGDTTIQSASALATPMLRPLRQKLLHLGLLIPDRAKLTMRVAPALTLLALLIFGLAKVVIGVSRDRPVGYLLALCVLVAIGILIFLANAPERSLMGENVLNRLRATNGGLQETASVKPDRLSSDDLTLAVGLFGPAVVTSGPMADVGRAMTRRRKRETSIMGHSFSCSSCSSGCGGGSCGGGCGGGCGGCGSS